MNITNQLVFILTKGTINLFYFFFNQEHDMVAYGFIIYIFKRFTVFLTIDNKVYLQFLYLMKEPDYFGNTQTILGIIKAVFILFVKNIHWKKIADIFWCL
jgi:hypothetical protein